MQPRHLKDGEVLARKQPHHGHRQTLPRLCATAGHEDRPVALNMRLHDVEVGRHVIVSANHEPGA